jgi:hypothetical protein
MALKELAHPFMRLPSRWLLRCGLFPVGVINAGLPIGMIDVVNHHLGVMVYRVKIEPAREPKDPVVSLHK